jgi:hypothetical protein
MKFAAFSHLSHSEEMPSKAKSPQNGPSAHLISCINHLGNLFKYLPKNLPLDPPNTGYGFGLDAEKVIKEGVWFTFNNCLEVSFQTHTLPTNGTIVFHE